MDKNNLFAKTRMFWPILLMLLMIACTADPVSPPVEVSATPTTALVETATNAPTATTAAPATETAVPAGDRRRAKTARAGGRDQRGTGNSDGGKRMVNGRLW